MDKEPYIRELYQEIDEAAIEKGWTPEQTKDFKLLNLLIEKEKSSILQKITHEESPVKDIIEEELNKIKNTSIPKILFHGTTKDKMKSICNKGILPGDVVSCGSFTKEGHEWDCIGNVSMSGDEKTATQFACFNSTPPGKDQAVIQINTKDINPSVCVKRDIFGKETEWKCFTKISPKMFDNIKLREFNWNNPNQTESLKEENVTCDYFKEK